MIDRAAARMATPSALKRCLSIAPNAHARWARVDGSQQDVQICIDRVPFGCGGQQCE